MEWLMPHKEIFLGRQPILDTKQNVVGFELLFRSAQSLTANIIDHSQASADTIINAFCGFGLQEVLGKHRNFINVNTEFLMSDLIELLPREQVVIELLEIVEITDDIIERCSRLKDMGFALALDDFCYNSAYEPMFDLVDIVKIDLLQTSQPALSEIVRYLKNKPLTLLAEKVETLEQFNECRGLGFDLFQGYYFARPAVLNRKKIDISRLTLLKLLEYVLTEAETREIEGAFKQNPNLSYNLLRLVNSVAMGMREKVSSISHAIVILGRQQLKRWIQLLLFTHGTTNASSSPLMQMAAMRGKLMELLVQQQGDSQHGNDFSDLAFMTGILSLLDTLLSIPMEEIVNQISLRDEVRQALLTREGRLGRLLLMNEKLEIGDFEAVNDLLRETGIDLSRLVPAQIEAMSWTNSISEVF